MTRPAFHICPNIPAGGRPRSSAFFTRRAETKDLRVSAQFENRPDPRGVGHA
jgi:hypothetical protein